MPAASTEIEILEMTYEDVPDVILIGQENNLSHWSAESYASEIRNKDSIALSLKHRGKVDGFITARLIMSNTSTINYDCEILNIAISKNLQNRGLGQMLLDEFLENIKSRNVSKIWLEVRETNAKAIKFYKKNGFSKQTQRKDYYSNPTENALIMKKTVDLSKKNEV